MKNLFIQKVCVSISVFTAVLSCDGTATVHLKVDFDKRLSTPISIDSMNRIAFAHDRITQVFGDEEAYTLQSDESHGQLFIKPTEINGDKAITLTVSTEKGMIQDLELLPQKITTRTIILKDDHQKNQASRKHDEQRGQTFGSLSTDFRGEHRFDTSFGHPFSEDRGGLSSGDYVSHVIRFIKTAVRQGDDYEASSVHDIDVITAPNLKIEGKNVLVKNGLKVSVYRVYNETNQEITLDEHEFSKQSVVAVALDKQTLLPKEACLLYVVQKVEQ